MQNPLRGEPDVGHLKASWPWVRALLHSVYDQPNTASVHAQFDRILDALTEELPKVAEHLDAARADVLAFTAFPKDLWRQIWSNGTVSTDSGHQRHITGGANPPDPTT